MKKLISLIICLALCLTAVPFAAAVDYQLIEEIDVPVKISGNTYQVHAFNASYEGNLYLSMRDIAQALNGTNKQFGFEFMSTSGDGESFYITTGVSYSAPGETASATGSDGEPFSLSLARNRLFVNGSERRYFSYRYGSPENLYMNLTDIQLILDIAAKVNGDLISLYPSRSFSVTVKTLDRAGYFDVIGSVLLGSSSTGKISYSSNADTSLPVASTSKLMTYLIIEEAIAAGTISRSDSVAISANALKLSQGEDALISMEGISSVPLTELETGMLVASSNECALALAEHVAGSEAAFVKLMNARAKELGLEQSLFYNCSGLPVYSSGLFRVKQQNRMSADDLFALTCYILENFPGITDITSQVYARLETLNYTTANSNPMVFNVGATGLKTGSTKASGQCLVACSADGTVVIVLGAEDGAVRGRAAELLFRSAGVKL